VRRLALAMIDSWLIHTKDSTNGVENQFIFERYEKE
jgi:hypothetical protein